MDMKEIKITRYSQVVGLVCFLLVVIRASGITVLTNQAEMEAAEQAPRGRDATVIDAAKALFSMPTTPMQWAYKAKDWYGYGRNYFSPPNIDFRSGGNTHEEEGTGEKMKEAVTRTLDESKATVENTAKSAAKTLKKTFSRKGDSKKKDHEIEL